MIIKRIDTYRDGGTFAIATDEGEICVDKRIGTNTKGLIYKGYPEKNNSNLISDQKAAKEELKKALRKFNSHYVIHIFRLLKEENK